MISGKILVTGAGGFIGRALLNELLSKTDAQVRATSRTLGHSSNTRLEIVRIPEIGPETDWSVALEGVACVVHLAGKAHVLKLSKRRDQSGFTNVNWLGTLNLARQATIAKVNKFIFLSSIGVNGNSTSGRSFKEEMLPQPQEPYAISKWKAEKGLIKIASRCSMDYVIIRPPLVYGHDAPGNFRRLLKIVKSGLPLPFSSINNRRSYIAIRNLTDFIVKVIYAEAANNETFLVSDGVDLSTAELIRQLRKALGQPPHLFSVSPTILMGGASLLGQRKAMDQLLGSLQVDSSKARRLLAWTPPESVCEAMGNLVIKGNLPRLWA